ncbi:unnamed protein product [Vitrella brassicaformis CCMP3155]|uniref:Uncharacterized protein n=1 Tax=Vitrella brassicaformis (strain CCMP3155) TaxID=1169540 RepID=A0A0G4EH31_VITBC|nr:unnamed protein product [Vitrella brassicaformis CCMP3155]|eukprot:CEL95547.1 unnamed protein product [Vitrella brassicaformis CCMP3155]
MQFLSCGSGGHVHVATKLTDTPTDLVAAKITHVRPETQSQAIQQWNEEVGYWSPLKHDNIVRLPTCRNIQQPRQTDHLKRHRGHDADRGVHTDTRHTFMEYSSEGDLIKFVRNISLRW